MSFFGRSYCFGAICSKSTASLLGTPLLPFCLHHSSDEQTHSFFYLGGQLGKKKYHLTKLSHISSAKSHGVWGLLDLRSFSKALLCKSFWRGINDEGIWGSIIQNKYLGGKELSYWYRRGSIGSAHGSPIWPSRTKIEGIMRRHLIWRFQSRDKILIYKDPLMCGKEELTIPGSLTSNLHRLGIFYWDGLIRIWNGPFPFWYEPSNLHMPPDMAILWNPILKKLRHGGFFRSSSHDFLTWRISDNSGSIYVKDIYWMLLSEGFSQQLVVFPVTFWKSGCQTKMIYFAWLIYHNKNLTWENLMKRGWIGPSICLFCLSAEEDNLHIFFLCRVAQQF